MKLHRSLLILLAIPSVALAGVDEGEETPPKGGDQVRGILYQGAHEGGGGAGGGGGSSTNVSQKPTSESVRIGKKVVGAAARKAVGPAVGAAAGKALGKTAGKVIGKAATGGPIGATLGIILSPTETADSSLPLGKEPPVE